MKILAGQVLKTQVLTRGFLLYRKSSSQILGALIKFSTVYGMHFMFQFIRIGVE